MDITNYHHIAIVLFGGLGVRYNDKLPKQFALIGDKPLMYYALSTLNNSPSIEGVLVVAPLQYLDPTKDIIEHYGFHKVDAVISGGDTREDSVFSALAYLSKMGADPRDVILIHDGDRPNLTEELIAANLAAAEKYGAAVTAIPTPDSVLSSEDGESIDNYLPRKMVYLAQTPQTFLFKKLYRAHAKARKNKKVTFTDDGSILVSQGFFVHIVPGSDKNIKITTKNDAAKFLALRKGSL